MATLAGSEVMERKQLPQTLLNLLSLFPCPSGLSQQPGSVEQISLHCSEGTLDWLYPQGALRLSLSPRLPSAAVGPGGGGGSSGLITACVKPSGDFHGAQLYLERDGVLELLLGDRGADPAAPPRVRCFSRLPGERLALYLQATPHQDISRRIAAFRYELRGDWTARLSLDSNRVSSEGEHQSDGPVDMDMIPLIGLQKVIDQEREDG